MVSRWAHNPKAVGSNPTPATKIKTTFKNLEIMTTINLNMNLNNTLNMVVNNTLCIRPSEGFDLFKDIA